MALGTPALATPSVMAGAASVTSASFTVPAGENIFAFVSQAPSSASVTPTAATVSDSQGLTWTKINERLTGGGGTGVTYGHGMTIWRAVSNGAAMTVTATRGSNVSDIRLSLVNFSGALNLATAQAGSDSGAPSVVLAGAPANGSVNLAFYQDSSATTTTPPTGYTELVDSFVSSSAFASQVCYNAGSPPPQTTTWAESTRAGAIVVNCQELGTTGTAAGAATVSGSSAAVATSGATAAGAAAVAGASAAVFPTAGSAAGAAATSAGSAAIAGTAGSAAGSASVIGAGYGLGSTGSAEGSAAVSGASQALATSAGSGAGSATASGASEAVAEVGGSAAAAATASGASESIASTPGNAAGAGVATGASNAVATTDGASAGLSAVLGESDQAIILITPADRIVFLEHDGSNELTIEHDGSNVAFLAHDGSNVAYL